MADLRRAGNPNNKHGHYYVQHEAAADDDPLVQTNFIYQDADFRGGRNLFVLGAVFATFVAPKSTIVHRVLTEENLDVINGTYQSAASINSTYQSFASCPPHVCEFPPPPPIWCWSKCY